MIRIVNRILFRRSETRNMFRTLASTSTPAIVVGRGTEATPGDLPWLGLGPYRFVWALPLAGGRRSPHGSGSLVIEPPAAVMASSADFENAWAETFTLRVSSPRPSTLTRPFLA